MAGREKDNTCNDDIVLLSLSRFIPIGSAVKNRSIAVKVLIDVASKMLFFIILRTVDDIS